MMGDLTASEKRMIAALDRIDYSIERAADGLRGAAGAPAPDPDTDELRRENTRLGAELGALQERQETALTALEDRLAQMSARLLVAEEKAVQLAVANEALIKANRELVSHAGEGPGDDQIRLALEAEVEALRAARAAEVAQMDEIVETLDRMLDSQPEMSGEDNPQAERG